MPEATPIYPKLAQAERNGKKKLSFFIDIPEAHPIY